MTVPGLYTQELKSVTRLQVLWGTSRVPWRLPGSSCLYAILGVQRGEGFISSPVPLFELCPGSPQSSGRSSCLLSVSGQGADPCGVYVLLGALGPRWVEQRGLAPLEFGDPEQNLLP